MTSNHTLEKALMTAIEAANCLGVPLVAKILKANDNSGYCVDIGSGPADASNLTAYVSNGHVPAHVVAIIEITEAGCRTLEA